MSQPAYSNEADLNEAIISQIQKHPCIYNTRDEEYRDPVKRKIVWTTVAASLGITVVHCQYKWRLLRDTFVRRYRRATSSEVSIGYQRPWVHYKSLTFLLPFVRTAHNSECLPLPRTEQTQNGEVFETFLVPSISYSDSRSSSDADQEIPSADYNEPSVASPEDPNHDKYLKRARSHSPSTCESVDSSPKENAQENAVNGLKIPTLDDQEHHFGMLIASLLRECSPKRKRRIMASTLNDLLKD